MLITFSVKDQKITHDLGKRTLIAGSVGEVQADLALDKSWQGYGVVIIFTNTNQQCGDLKPVKYEGKPFDIPEKALRAGKLYISVVGFAEDGKRKTTQKWDIQQAITVQECGAMGSTDLFRSVVQGGGGSTLPNNVLTHDDIAAIEDIRTLLDEVIGSAGEGSGAGAGCHCSNCSSDIATENEIGEMLDEVFSSQASQK